MPNHAKTRIYLDIVLPLSLFQKRYSEISLCISFLTWSCAAVLSSRKKKISNSCGLFIKFMWFIHQIHVVYSSNSCGLFIEFMWFIHRSKSACNCFFLNISIFSCSAAGGICVSPEVCVCNPGQFGPSCGSKCTCKNGECNGGQEAVKIF